MERRRPAMDRDRLRAAGLSLLIHALAVLGLAVWIDVDRPEPPLEESYLVLDLGEPVSADALATASADDRPAPSTPDASVASDLPGRPLPGAPDPTTESGGDPALTEPSPPEPDVVEPPPGPEEAAIAPPAPAPAARPPESVAPAPSPRVAATVPDIDVPEVDARPLPSDLPIPPVSAEPIAGAIALPGAVPTVDAGARDVPTPEVAVEAPAAGRALRTPAPRVAAAAATPVATPLPNVAAPSGRTVSAPDVAVARPRDARSVGVEAPNTVRAVRRLPTPSVRAAVRPVAPAALPGAAAAVPDDGGLAGGDAPAAGQEGGVDDAPPTALGRAADDASPGDGGARAAAPSPLRETRPRPIAVILDNADGYPQAGLPQASWIAEMPVEGGLTRLMAFFDAGEPARVGPVRSARDYLVEVAGRADAVLVHDGGSPSALIALSQGVAPSVNAYTSGDRFERVADRSAPYDLYSTGSTLRDAVRSMRIDANRLLTGFRPVAPDVEATPAARVDLDWSGVYSSGFRYLPAQDRYRWIRNGDDALSADGTAVQVEAVLVARIEARPIPGDPAGRLYVPINGGPALLLWRGTVQQGRWSVDGGIRFEDAEGRRVSLEALTTWAAFVPDSVEVEVR